ncbi:MAG TPA: multicopper oxidase domain-containing protein [Candidatus Sulfomarinibacteraceae bacterium]|nr:multicopper oxidase domain-containing protein [Candidatus Sulfomarinibacteraceae bacterium]
MSIGGKNASGLLYNGTLPGPVFEVRSGESVSIPFTNGLDEPTTVHWHGLVVPTAVDGQPQDPIAAAGSFTYAFPVRQRAGLSWYHPHPDMATSSQVALGLAGGFLIRDTEEDALGLPSGLFEVPLVLRDANFDKAGNLSYNGTASGFTGKTLLVNGVRDPYLDTSPAIHRFRILGGSNSRVFRLALSNGAAFTLIGNDGGLLPSVATVAEIDLSPGERVDVLVDLRSDGGKTVSLRDLNSGWTLLELRVANTTPVAGSIPAGALSTVPLLGPPARTRTFSFDGMTRINGQLFDLNRIDFEVPNGQIEDWVFRTGGNAPHPVHIHGASFQVKARTGGRGRLFPWEAGWKDTVLLNDGETVTVRIRFDLAGRYLIHCHKLEHEDAGMMTNFRVI